MPRIIRKGVCESYINKCGKYQKRRKRMRKLSVKVKKSLAFIMAASLFVQSAGFTKSACADEVPQDYSGLVWTDQSTDEILNMVDKGLELETFFEGDLTKGTTKEELLEWKSQGKDIKEVVLERARERSKTITYNNESYTYDTGETDEAGSHIAEYRAPRYLSAPSPASDGKYYLTECYLPGDKGNVNLSGTQYADALFNTKTGGRGTSTPWYITLGGDEAMCVSYEGNASAVGRDHHYIETDINSLKNNPYFIGGNDYPVEAYLKGACYAYERILGSGTTSNYTFWNRTGAMDASFSELCRNAGPVMVTYSGREINYAVLQIITWRIAQGSFNANDLSYEHQVATAVFNQMYGEDTGYGVQYAALITHFYDYYAKCAMEAASGNYNNKYSSVSVKYWSVQGSNAVNWQDFITWDVGNTVPSTDRFKVNKYGKAISETYKYQDATFEIYSDSGLTNKIGSFTTDSNGEAVINIVEGVYYLKETKAPNGTVISDRTITLTVVDSIVSADVTNDEIYNGLIFQKFDSVTDEVISDKAGFALYEYVNGKYLKLCNITFTETGFESAKVKVPAYSYYISGGTTFTYHNNDGTVAKTMTDSNFYYTPVNQGKFKIVDESAPAGYKININGKTFTMNTAAQGYIWQFTAAATGIKEEPDYAGVKISKNDTLSGDKLTGAEFKLQESINGIWYYVGKLEYDNSLEVYKTSAGESYSFRDSSANIIFTNSGTDYPLIKTSYNKGKFRIVETKLPNESYANAYIKTFTVAPTTDRYMYDFTAFSDSALNTGKSILVKTAKYDALTSEQLANEDVATISVYEYNSGTKEWQKLGNLKYNAGTKLYETGSEVYTPHKIDGSKSRASIGRSYLPGYLYYTSVNQGKFKVVETINPQNYMLGVFDTKSLQTTVYEKEFSINEDTEDGQMIDLTDIGDAAKDTGIYVILQLSKYDGITKEKIMSGYTKFTVSEKIKDKWYEVGTLVYDETYNVYKTRGMSLKLHNSEGKEVYEEASAYGLYYTTANQGVYKVEETSAPNKYTLGSAPFCREFNITTDANDGKILLTAFDSSAKDTGIRGKVNINKYDAATEELVRTGDMVVTVYENINDVWYEMGTLKYDGTEKRYSTTGADITYRNSAGRKVSTDGISDYETGWLYYTTANQGRFKIVETAAPAFYALTHPLFSQYERQITLTENHQEFTYTDFREAIKNLGVNVILRVNKYDVMTKELTPEKNTKFVIQEYVLDKNNWMNVAEMNYDSTGDVYTSQNSEAVFHNADGTVKFTNADGRLYYTTQNLGKFRVVEKSAPAYYTNSGYIMEFDITRDAVNGVVNLSEITKSAQNLGISGNVSVTKYDRVTDETVRTNDAVFTVSEKIKDQWYVAGTLVYNESKGKYVSDNATFTFHNENGDVIDASDIAGFENGKLYYTSANLGRFKVTETVPPTNYTNEPFTNEEPDIFEREFLIDTDNESNDFNSVDDAAKNAGKYTQVSLLKYDYMTGMNVKFNNAEFIVEEKVNNRWLKVGIMGFDKENRIYTTKDTKVVLHNSEAVQTYVNGDGRLYYTTANNGQYRIVEKSAPSNYILGSNPYTYEFNVLESTDNLIDLTDRVKAANNLGNYGIVETLKYDSITNEKVRTTDTEFMVYEFVNGSWQAVGALVYDEGRGVYGCTSVNFIFHNEDGSVIDISHIPDFTVGRLYYTTANEGKFKVAETMAPENYTQGTFSKEFNVTMKNGEVFSYVTTEDGALNRGISIPVQVRKYDLLTNRSVELKDTVFAVQEHIADLDEWMTVGTLVYDGEKDIYSSKGMEKIVYHDSTGQEAAIEAGDELTYTSANLGVFRVVEISAPTHYENGMYINAFNITADAVINEDGTAMIDLSDVENGAKNIGKTGMVKLSKFDAITGEKVLTGDAEFTVYEYISELQDWIRVGILSYNDADREYVSEGSEFIFHDEEGNEIDTSDIETFEKGRLYYTTANGGKYKVVETKAPEYYMIDGYEREFSITENETTELTAASAGAYDMGVRGNVSLVKADSITNKNISGAVFAAQEWSENNGTWLTVGYLTDQMDGTYTTDGMNILLHTGTDAQTVEALALHYTTQNLGKYRIIEVKAPKGYINDMYVSDTLNVNEDMIEI